MCPMAGHEKAVCPMAGHEKAVWPMAGPEKAEHSITRRAKAEHYSLSNIIKLIPSTSFSLPLIVSTLSRHRYTQSVALTMFSFIFPGRIFHREFDAVSFLSEICCSLIDSSCKLTCLIGESLRAPFSKGCRNRQ